MKRLHDHHAPEAARKPVGPRAVGKEAKRGQKRVERAVAPENALHAQRADERRENHRQKQRACQKTLSRKVIAVGQPCERQGNDDRKKRRRDCQAKRIHKSLRIDGVAEDLLEVEQRVVPRGRIHQPPAQHIEHGEEEKQNKKHQREYQQSVITDFP